MAEYRFYHFSTTGIFFRMETMAEAVTALEEGGFIWLNFYKPEKEDLNRLVDLIGIHPLSVEDCFDEKQVPKIEHFQNNSFIIFNAFSYKDETLHTDEVGLFIGKNFLITVSGHNSDDRRPLQNIEEIIENEPRGFKKSPAVLLHKVLDYLVDQKFEAFDTMEDELEDAEDCILEDLDSFNPMTLLKLKRHLAALRKSLYHEREILVKINRLDCPFVPEKLIAPFRDIYDHLSKFYELTDTYRETETSLMELYTSFQNNMMTRASNETNATVKRLTMIATVFMPLTLFASIGGMSEWTMITGGEENWKISYGFLMLAMIIIGGLSYFFIRGLERKSFPSVRKRDDND